MAAKKIVIELTPLELRTLRYAVGSIGDDIDDTGLTPAGKRAYLRLRKKLRVI